jgi:hypothetical protein
VPTWAMLMPQHTFCGLASGQDGRSEVCDERPVLALDPLAVLDGLKRDRVLVVDEFRAAAVGPRSS